MQVYFLGTGTSQGIPVIGSNHPVCLSTDFRDKRLRVSVWIKNDFFSIVIDCGPDFRQQMLNSQCDYLDAILFTHEHADHTAGLDDIRPFYFQQGDIPVYGHKRVLDNLKKRFDYIFSNENKYPGAPSILPIEVEKETDFFIKNYKVTPIIADHGNLEIFGYRIESVVYLTDVKSIEDKEIEKIKNCELLIINALREEQHHSHLSLKEALEIIKKVAPKKAYLTHISHHLGFHAEVEKNLPENVFLAYDNLIINL